MKKFLLKNFKKITFIVTSIFIYAGMIFTFFLFGLMLFNIDDGFWVFSFLFGFVVGVSSFVLSAVLDTNRAIFKAVFAAQEDPE